MWQAPPYWRRTAALAHAHLVLQFFDFQGVDVDSFDKWVSHIHPLVGDIALTLDSWAEPAWLPDREFFLMPWLISAGYAINLCERWPSGAAVYGEVQVADLDTAPGKAVFAQRWGALPDLLRG